MPRPRNFGSLPMMGGKIPKDLLPTTYENPNKLYDLSPFAKEKFLKEYEWLYKPHKTPRDLDKNMRYPVFVDKWSLQVYVNYIGWANTFLARNILKYYHQDVGRIEFLYPKEFPEDYQIVKIIPSKFTGVSHSVIGKYYFPRGLMVRSPKKKLRKYGVIHSQEYDDYLERQIKDAIHLYEHGDIKFKNLHQAYEVVILRNVLLFTTFSKRSTTLVPGEFMKAHELLMRLRDKYFKYLQYEHGIEGTGQ